MILPAIDFTASNYVHLLIYSQKDRIFITTSTGSGRPELLLWPPTEKICLRMELATRRTRLKRPASSLSVRIRDSTCRVVLQLHGHGYNFSWGFSASKYCIPYCLV